MKSRIPLAFTLTLLFPVLCAQAGEARKDLPIDRCIQELASPDPAVRRHAREGLWKTGERAYRALKALGGQRNTALQLRVKMLLFRMEPYFGPWHAALSAARFYAGRWEHGKALRLFLVAGRKHERLRQDKWYQYLATRSFRHCAAGSLEVTAFEDWELFITGQYEVLADTRRSSSYRQECLFRIGRHKELLAQYPEGKYAPFARYSLVSGHAYFEPPPFLEIKDPKKEIAAWPEFIAKNPSHPGLDDAAYRLGRAYEVTGEPVRAVHAFHKAAILPDGEYKWKGRMRSLYVLDSLCSQADLDTLSRSGPTPAVREEACLTKAVLHLRAGLFKEARDAFQTFLEQHSTSRFAPAARSRVKVIQERLLPLAGQSRASASGAAALYELGRHFYHDILACYNPIWEGKRAAYLSYEINALGRSHAFDNPAYFEAHNNYMAAARYFHRLLAEHPGSNLADRAHYSLGNCYLKAPALNHFSRFQVTRGEMLDRSRKHYAAVARTIPPSTLRGDAVRMMAVIDRLPDDWMRQQ